MNVIRKLRLKFVLTIMAIVTAMLLMITSFFVVSVMSSLRKSSQTLLNQVISQDSLSAWPAGQGSSTEASLPYFTVTVLRSGQAVIVASQFYELSQETIKQVVNECLTQEADDGVLERYGLRYLRQSGAAGWQMAFVDMTQERSTVRSVVRICVLIFVAGLAVFFVISLLLARWVVRPVERSWNQQRQFVADASHELKTPLTVILSNADMLKHYGGAMEERDCQRLDNIRASSLQMKELVEELLLLARSDSGGEKKPALTPVNLSDLVEDAALQFDAVFFESGHALESRVEPALYVPGEQGKLKRMVEILLDNARKYASPGGAAVVSLRPEGTKRVRLAVSNEGEPIPPEQLERLFERFFRADKARSSEGFGLGLSIAQTIVQEHGGKIWAESANGQNCFYVTLPRSRRPLPQEGRKEPSA